MMRRANRFLQAKESLMHKHKRECRTLCQTNGLTVLRLEQRSKHLAVICAEGMVIMPSTPSDRRWRRNAKAYIRRIAQHS